MVAKTVVVKNAAGLHLKPAACFCKEAVKYKSLVTFTCGLTTANAKSVLSVLGACVRAGDEIELVCDGPDEEEALAAMIRAVESGLGEEPEKNGGTEGPETAGPETPDAEKMAGPASAAAEETDG